ncbi:MAG: protein TolR [Gammaproteobacteria bacterium]|nr:protein TolR [Gammaproteobacteria bacterium]
MGMSTHQRKRPMSEINVVPYIDVMLVLLVIFMVTAPMLTQGVKVDLPQATAEPIPVDSNQEPLIVAVNASGAYFLETGGSPETPLALEDVQAQVSKVLAEKPKTDVLVRGDANVGYGMVVRLMAALQQAGAANVGLITEEPRE